MPGLFAFLDVKEYLEGLFGRKVDLVSRNAVKQPLRDRIYGEAVCAMRNVVVHKYSAVDERTVWDTATSDPPELVPLLQGVLRDEPEVDG